jgi:hypothetical protein
MCVADILLTIIVAAGVPTIVGLSRYISKLSTRMTVVETKMDIYLDHIGFDVPKVNETIKKNMKELKKNNRPSVGCINIKELYRDKEG